MKDVSAHAGGMSFNHHITRHFWEQVNRKKTLKQLLYPASSRAQPAVTAFPDVPSR